MTEPTTAEVVRTVHRIEEDVREMKKDMKAQGSTFIPRGEFEAWRTAIDREIVGLKEQLAKGFDEIKAEISARRVSWPAVTAAVCAVVSSAAAIFPKL